MHDLQACAEEGPLGQGGYAAVVRAVWLPKKERVALKKSRDDAESKARTKNEIAVQRLRLHGNIMPVLDWADDGSWFTMPLAVGDVGQIREQKPDKKFRDADILRFVEDCASALGVAHRNGFVHRDLSPRNILWVRDRWMVADWGCVRLPDGTYRAQLTRANTAIGTAPWASPEALSDGKNVDARTDIFSLGRIVAWLVTGVLPEPNRESTLEAGSPWAAFVRETTKFDMEERPPTIYGALALLEPVIKALSSAREAEEFHAGDVSDTSKVVVDTLKRYLVDPQSRIVLPELLTRETEAVWERLTPEEFNVQTLAGDTAEKRVQKYFDYTSPLIGLIVAGCAYGDEAHAPLWTKMLRRIGSPSGQWGGEGRLLSMRYLPATLLMHAGALAATATERWYNIRALARDTIIKPGARDDEFPAVHAAALRESFDDGLAKSLPGMDRRYAPASEWLFTMLREPLRFLLPSDSDYDDAFDRMEYMLALAYADTSKTAAAPPVRVTAKGVKVRRWKSGETFGQKLAKEIEAGKNSGSWAPGRAGIINGGADRVIQIIGHIEKDWAAMAWH